jgi:hypothetical protein
MLRLSKTQFSRAIEGSDAPTDRNAIRGFDAATDKQSPLSAQSQSSRTSKVLIIALVVALGIGAGWVGGKVLNGRMSRSTAAPPSDVSGDSSAPNSQLQPESRPVKHAETPGSATPSQLPEVEQPAIVTDSRTKDSEPKEAPPKVPRVEKDEEADKPALEDPSKEIGRDALKKMSKESKKTKRASGNKNEDEDRQ